MMMKFGILILMLCVLAAPAWAQQKSATVTCDPVTKNAAGGTLTCTPNYNFYRGTDPAGSDQKVVNTAGPIATPLYVDTVDLMTVYYYSVSALCQGDPQSESPRSTPLYRFLKAEGTPAAPTGSSVKVK